jgi:NhaP-type Na+/H+ or K+/H+ antiporter
MGLPLALFLLIVALYTSAARWLSRYSVTMPMIFIVVGILLWRTDTAALESGIAETIVEVTLALLLFADASTLSFGVVRRDFVLPTRLLMIGMPLTIALGAVVAWAFAPQAGLATLLLIGTILAPTDAALGLPIFNNPRVPARVRRALNVESGLNDGIATPLVTLFTVMALATTEFTGREWLVDALLEIVLAGAVGAVLGLVGGWLFRVADARGWSTSTAVGVGNIALALAAFFGAIAIGGNGFIAAFVAGILFGWAAQGKLHAAVETTETAGTLLSVFVWAWFGATAAVPILTNFDPRPFLYAVLSLALVRIVAIAVALHGTGMRLDTKLMMGWLGPRGLASVVFSLMTAEAFHAANLSGEMLLAAAAWTILLSVFLHGLSAVPLANWYANRLAKAPADAPELVEVPELDNRRRHVFDPAHTARE